MKWYIPLCLGIVGGMIVGERGIVASLVFSGALGVLYFELMEAVR
jgi:hypothetical protein